MGILKGFTGNDLSLLGNSTCISGEERSHVCFVLDGHKVSHCNVLNHISSLPGFCSTVMLTYYKTSVFRHMFR